jgi:hypothetical protein
MSDSTSKSIDYTPASPKIENSSESIDYTPSSPKLEMPSMEDSDGDDVQILEPPPIPVVNLVTDEEEGDDKELEMDKKVKSCEGMQKTVKRTRIEFSPSPKRSKKDSNNSGYEGDDEMSKSKQIKSFWS